MGEWLDKTGLTQIKGILSDKFATKIDKPNGIASGKFLQTNSNGDAVWGNFAAKEDITEAVDDWLEQNISNPDSPPLDRSLTSAVSASPADMVGDLRDDANNLYAYKETSGTIAMINDAFAKTVKQMQIAINPDQDLHLYDYPWPGGSGKNLFSTVMEQGSISSSDGENATSNYNTRIRTKDFISLNAGTYVISVDNNALQLSGRIYSTDGTFESSDSEWQSLPHVITLFASKKIRFILRNSSNSEITTAVVKNIQIESGSTVTSYVPYSNICPINGWTGCNVIRTGKNLCNNMFTNGMIDNYGRLDAENEFHKTSDYILVKNNTTYVLSGTDLHVRTPSNSSPAAIRYAFYDRDKKFISRSDADTASLIVAMTTTSDTAFVRFFCGRGGINVQFEEGPVATRYEPFCDEIYTTANSVEGKYINVDGSTPENADFLYTDLIPVNVGNKIYAQMKNPGNTARWTRVHGYNSSGTWVEQIDATQIAIGSSTSYTFTIPNGIEYIRISVAKSLTNISFCVEKTFSVMFPDSAGTVYGGIVSINQDGTGELTVNKAYANLTGKTFTKASSGNGRFIFTTTSNGFPKTQGRNVKIISSHLKGITETEIDNVSPFAFVASDENIVIQIGDASIDTTAKLTDWLSAQNTEGTPLTICYDVALPSGFVFFNAPQVQLRFDTNNVFAETGDILSMLYPVSRSFSKEESDARYAKFISKTIETPADVMSFSDGADDVPMMLKVAVEPLQDLHGYDNPWPAGGGVNILDFAQYFTEGESVTQNGVTATFSNGYLKVTGTNTGSTFNIIYKACNVELPAGTYIMPSNLNIRCNIDEQGNNNYASVITAETSVKMIAFYVFASTNATVNYNIPMMMVKGTTRPTTYSPYSNICPISGRTGANVTRTGYGANLFDTSKVTLGKWIQGGGNIINMNQTGYGEMIHAFSNKYSFKVFGTGDRFKAMAEYDENKQFIKLNALNDISEGSVTLQSNTKYIVLECGKETGTLNKADIDAMQIMVCAGDIPTEFKAYNSTYSISFPSSAGTVYGGELTINRDGTGTLVVDKAMVLISNLAWTYQSQYTRFLTHLSGIEIKGSPRVTPLMSSVFTSIHDGRALSDVPNNGIYAAGTSDNAYVQSTDYDNTTSFVAAYGTQQIVYKLEEPRTYELSALEVINTLKGINNIYADTGDILSVDYSADTKIYVDASKDEASASAMSLIADTEPDVSTKRYYSGSMLIHDGELYEATDTIAIGDALIENQNIKKTSLNYQFGYTYLNSIFNFDLNNHYVEACCHKVGPMRMVNAMLTKDWFNSSLFMSSDPPYESELYFPSHLMRTENNQTVIESCMLKYTKADLKWSLIRSDGTVIDNIATSSAISSTDKIHLFAIWFV